MSAVPNTNSDISSFISGFDGGLRANRFLVVGDFPQGVDATNPAEQFTYHVRGANIPASDLSQIGVPYRGREYKIPGNRTYATWQMTLIDDTNFTLWQKFHKWANLINSHTDNVPTNGINLNFTGLMKDWSVKQLDINGTCVRHVKLHKCWPSVIGEISFLMEDNESFCTYTVDLEYQYFTIESCTSTTTTTTSGSGSSTQ